MSINTFLQSYKKYAHTAQFWFVIMGLASVPFNEAQWPWRWSGLSVILLAVSAILQFNFKEKWRHIRQKPLVWVFPAYFLLAVVGILWTDNMHEAGIVLGLRASCLLLPLVLLGRSAFSDQQMRWMKWTLSIAVFAAVLASFRLGLSYLLEGLFHDSQQLESAFFVHRNYLSVMLLFMCFWWVKDIFEPSAWLWEKILAFLMLGFCMWYTYIIRAKGPLLFFVISLGIVFALYLFRNRSVWAGLAVSIVFLALLAAPFVTSPKAREYAVKLYHHQRLAEDLNKGYDWRYSLDERNAILMFCERVLAEEGVPLHGVGTGDLEDRLAQHYCQESQYWCEQHYNPHNQFLMVAMRWGFPMMAVWVLGVFLWPLAMAFRQNEWLFVFLLIFTGFNLLTECYLNRESGLQFFLFFWLVLAGRLYRSKHVK